jgi:hypothetical protein
MAKYAQNGLRMHLLQFQNVHLSGSPPFVPMALGSCLWHSTRPLLYKLRLLLQFFLRTLYSMSYSENKYTFPSDKIDFVACLI